MATATFIAAANIDHASDVPQGIENAYETLFLRPIVENEQGEERPRVLVVDDDPSIRRMMIAALRREGYDFFEAANGKEALEIMRRERPSVVLLDLMMPMVSGWDVLKERASDPDLYSIPVIVVSANRGPELATAMDGICAFLPKPFDITVLNTLVRSCLVPEQRP